MTNSAATTTQGIEWQPCEVTYFHSDYGMLIQFEPSDSYFGDTSVFSAYVPFCMFDEGQVVDFWERLEGCANECHDATEAEEWGELAQDIINALWNDTTLY